MPVTPEAFVRSETTSGVCTIAFYHPQSNALPHAILSQLAAAIENAGKDHSSDVIVLKSAGDRAFCAGASFDELLAISSEAEGLAFFSGFADVINAMRQCPKFIICRVQGKAVGGGIGIAAAADYTLATRYASIKLSELAIGIGPFVVSPAIERKMGLSACTQLTMDATNWRDALWAEQHGLYASVHEDADSMDEAIEQLARTLANSNPEAMRALKSNLWKGYENWNELLAERAAVSGKLVLSDFTREAISRFKS